MDTQKLDAKVRETTVSPQPHTHAIWHADILELLLQVNAVADSGSAAAPLSGIDTHSRLPCGEGHPLCFFVLHIIRQFSIQIGY